MTSENLRFPEGFLWGASTSAHQVEGDNVLSDWWEWEHSTKRVAELKRRGLDPADFQSGKACDHYNRFKDDITLLKQLHLNAYRFSIEWARVEPQEGRIDDAALTHYANVIQELKRQGIEPIVTLHHQTNPAWFTKQYGWEHRKAPELFERYAKRVAERLGRDAKWWLTINEPKLVVLRTGPSRVLNPLLLLKAFRNLMEAHRRAYAVLHAYNPVAHVSLAHNFQAWSASDFFSVDEAVIRAARILDHEWFLGNIKDQLDYIGVNYYRAFRLDVKRAFKGFREIGTGVVSDMGWDVYPKGLFYVLRHLSREYRLPLLVTENGIADSADSRRTWFIVEHLKAVRDAIAEGADIQGYCYWSLLDNFEWDWGFEPRFGLVEIDYATQERRIRESARIYGQIARRNSLPSKASS